MDPHIGQSGQRAWANHAIVTQTLAANLKEEQKRALAAITLCEDILNRGEM